MIFRSFKPLAMAYGTTRLCVDRGMSPPLLPTLEGVVQGRHVELLKGAVVKQIRWMIQVSPKGIDNWQTRDDLTYSGWFYSTTVSDEPSEALLDDFNRAVEELTWLDVRLMQETRSLERTIIRSVNRPD